MLWTAFTIGLFGGLHCTLMCSPLVSGIFKNTQFAKGFWVYQLGRITTYGLLGILIYFLGKGFSIIGLQNAVSIALGVLVIYLYVIPNKWKNGINTSKIENLPYQKIKSYFSHFIQRKDLLSRFVMGGINGLLPCGLVYLALITATTGSSLEQSVLFMLLFGLGTLPWLVGSHFVIRNVLLSRFNSFVNKLKPVLAFSIGLFLLLRGFSVQYIHIPLPSTGGNTNHSIEIPICGG